MATYHAESVEMDEEERLLGEDAPLVGGLDGLGDPGLHLAPGGVLGALLALDVEEAAAEVVVLGGEVLLGVLLGLAGHLLVPEKQ